MPATYPVGMPEPSHTAIGTWSGGRYLHFGEAISEPRLQALLTPGDGLDTLLTADAYGAGEADRLLGRALAGSDRDAYCVVGAIGHDFYEGERDGARGFPRFTDPRLRGPDEYADYVRMATERSLERLGIDAFDVLLLHNPDRTGYESETVWNALRAVRDEGLTRRLGVAPGPANGFTLDVIDCLERFGELIDWAMVILNPLEPWPGELCLAAAQKHDVRVITRVVDYGGLFWDDVKPDHEFPPRDHRTFRPDGWVRAGAEKLERLRPIAERHGLTMLQLAAQWCLAHDAVACTVPTLIQEVGGSPIEVKRVELLATPAEVLLDADEVAQIRAIGDNTGSMALKGAGPDHEGESRPDRWALSPELDAVARRWGIEPDRDLRQLTPARG
jgi:aryl-alcohol dehydrogenase-like predicted oxidoreductase